MYPAKPVISGTRRGKADSRAGPGAPGSAGRARRESGPAQLGKCRIITRTACWSRARAPTEAAAGQTGRFLRAPRPPPRRPHLWPWASLDPAPALTARPHSAPALSARAGSVPICGWQHQLCDIPEPLVGPGYLWVCPGPCLGEREGPELRLVHFGPEV